MAAFSDSADSGQNIRQSWGTETDIVHDVSMLDIGSDTVEPVLCQWHRLELKYFCKHHMEELCTTCRRMKHNNCDSILDIKQATKAIYSKDHSEKLMQSIRGLCKQFDDCKTVAEGLKDNLQAKKAVHLDNVQQTRKTINDFLDKLDANAVADINRNFTQIKQATEEKINVCDASISALKSSLSDVGETKSIRNQTGKFIELNRATQQIKQYNDVIKQLHSEVSGIDANAEPALALSGAFESLENVFTETSKLTKLYCQTIVMPVYTGVPETESRDHEQVSNDGRSVLQAQDNTNSSQTRRRKIAPQRAHAVPGQEPLTAAMLAGASAQEQKQMLGERMFPLIQRMHTDETGLTAKVTGMLLELDNEELLDMLASTEKLESRVNEALDVLVVHEAK